MTKIQAENQTFNKTVFTAVATAIAVLIFSFLASPFIRVFASTAKSKIFWFVGLFLVTGLFVFHLSIASIYVGAVWMTLGLYSEFEKRGLSWRKASLLGITSGFIFAVFCFFLMKNSQSQLSEIKETILLPLETALKNRLTADEITQLNLAQYIPGIFLAILTTALALSLIFEIQIFNLLKLKREKLVSSMKWIEFRVSDSFVWVALTAVFFSLVNFQSEIVRSIALNISIVSGVVLFFQGISIIEYMLRFYRVGFFTKLMVYLFILGWAGPAVVILGLADYWLEFRKKMRLKLK